MSPTVKYILGLVISYLAGYAVCMAAHQVTGAPVYFDWACVATALVPAGAFHAGNGTMPVFGQNARDIKLMATEIANR